MQQATLNAASCQGLEGAFLVGQQVAATHFFEWRNAIGKFQEAVLGDEDLYKKEALKRSFIKGSVRSLIRSFIRSVKELFKKEPYKKL